MENDEEIKKEDTSNEVTKETPKEESTTNKNSIDTKKILTIVAVVTVLIIVFCLGRYSNNQDTIDDEEVYSSGEEETTEKKSIFGKKESKVEGTYYNQVNLVDTQANVVAFTGLIPEGWQASIQSNWQVVSPDYPGLEEVTIISPDGKASIVIDSQQQYAETSDSFIPEGVNYEYYTTYLHYMDADTFVQYFMDNTYSNSELIKDLEDNADTLNQARQLQQAKIEKSNRDLQVAVGTTGMTFNLTGADPTMSRRQYKVGNAYLEGSCVIIPITSTIYSQYYTLTNTYWQIPYSIVYYAEDKETFDKYYDDYNFIVANSQFTTDYYAMIEYVSSYIANIKSSQAAAKAQASLDATNSYIDSNYSSTSSSSTNERVMNMWDDVIKEVDEYVTEDGGRVKTSMYNDVVAQDGDKFFVGSSTSDIPAGFTELTKADASNY